MWSTPRRRLLITLAALAVTTLSVAAVAATNGSAKSRTQLEAILHDSSGKSVGRLTLTPGRHRRMTVAVHAKHLTPGIHGMHVHEVGLCVADTAGATTATPPFSSAGSHLKHDPTEDHASHEGDIPPLLVMHNGTASMRFVTDRLRQDDLMDSNGSAIIVHVGPDNFGNIPQRYQSSAAQTPGPDATTLATGDAGDRAACGLLKRVKHSR